MGAESKIEWTDATWNPVRGCTKVSAGCRNCYAETFAERWRGIPGHPFEQGFDLRLVPEKLEEPLRWKRPRRIFVNSMSDLFHEDVPFEYLEKVFAVMALTPHHTYQVLTKRPERMLEFFTFKRPAVTTDFPVSQMAQWRIWAACEDFLGRGSSAPWNFRPGEFDKMQGPWPLPNVWLGVSVEDQRAADERISLLLQTPAAVRFISCEPLLGLVNLAPALGGHGYADTPSRRVDWVIVGGESGPGARPMHPSWARSLRNQCEGAGVPFFFKQWGEWEPVEPHFGGMRASARETFITRQGRTGNVWGEGEDITGVRPYWMRKVGKLASGRLLDGKEHSDFPRAQ